MSKHHQSKNHHRDDHDQFQEEAVLLALKQGMGLVYKGFEIHAIRGDGATEVIARASNSSDLWHEAYKALQHRELNPIPAVDTAACDPSETTCLKIFTDGGSRGNPGPSASGYVIMDLDDQILEQGGEYLGITTNNQAEYIAVRIALEAARKFAPEQLTFYIDSQLVVNQLKGTYKVKNADIKPVHEAILSLAATYKEVSFNHVYREFNTLADKQVNIILDQQNSVNEHQ